MHPSIHRFRSMDQRKQAARRVEPSALCGLSLSRRRANTRTSPSVQTVGGKRAVSVPRRAGVGDFPTQRGLVLGFPRRGIRCARSADLQSSLGNSGKGEKAEGIRGPFGWIRPSLVVRPGHERRAWWGGSASVQISVVTRARSIGRPASLLLTEREGYCTAAPALLYALYNVRD
jgi:hypothetical protein